MSNAINPRPVQSLSILHVVDSLEFGGLERVVTDLAIAQHKQGHRVAVFSLNRTEGFTNELRQAGIEVTSGEKSGPFDVRTIRSLRQTAINMEADVVHAHNFVPNYYCATALLGLLGKTKQVLTCHDMGTRLQNRRLRWLFRASLTRTARVAMVGQQVHDKFVSSGMVAPTIAQTVLNGVPVARFTVTPERRSHARAMLSISSDVLVIGCVGRLVALKNHALMIDLMPALLKIFPDLRLVIVGYGELQKALEQQAAALGVSTNVLITGQRSDVADLLPAFDVFALPSLTEGVSIALLEACSTGLAVVATAVGGNPEIVRNQQTGLLIEPSDEASTKDALTRLLREPELRSQFGNAARRWVQANASTEALERDYRQFYLQAMA